MARTGRSFPGNRNVQYKYNALFLPLVLTPGTITVTGQSVRVTATLTLGAGTITFTGQSIKVSGTSALAPGSILFTGQQISLSQTATPVIAAIQKLLAVPSYLYNVESVTYNNLVTTYSYISYPEVPIYAQNLILQPYLGYLDTSEGQD